MKKILSAIVCITAILALQAQQTAELEELVNRTRREANMQHSVLAVTVYNATTGKVLYSQNGDISVTPASVAKLFTTGVGFARLGRDFRFTTKITVRGDIDREGVLHGNIYLIGGGDPLLGSYRYRQTTPDSIFAAWTRALRMKGIRRVDGRVCYNTTIFDDQPLHDSWQWGDIGNYYSAGVSGLNFHENMFFVYFNAGKSLGFPATAVRTVPKNIDIHSTCEVTTAAENSGDRVTIYGTPTSNERLYRGTVPLGKNDFPVRGALPNPARTCADLFASYLRTRGISVSLGAREISAMPDSLHAIMDYHSAPYSTIAQYTNRTSNNIYAESIFKYLGYKQYRQGTFDNGAKALMDYLADKGLPTDGIRIVDGSGLSRLNRLTTDFLCRYLTAISKEPFFDTFRSTLGKAGESGTARNILPSLPDGTDVYLKTGTMDGVKAYAGYIVTASETLTFAIVSNSYDCSNHEAGERLTRILQAIVSNY